MSEPAELAHWRAMTRELIEDVAIALYPQRPLIQARFRRLMWVAMYGNERRARKLAVEELEALRLNVYRPIDPILLPPSEPGEEG